MFLTPKELDLNQQQINEICEKLWKEVLENSKKKHSVCPECGVALGENHLNECKIKQWQKSNFNIKSPSIWKGINIGIKECYDLKLICFNTSPQVLKWTFDLNKWSVSGKPIKIAKLESIFSNLDENEIVEYKDNFGNWYLFNSTFQKSKFFSPVEIRKRKITIPQEQWGVHKTHCCSSGCKYGDKDCPVVLGLISGIPKSQYENGF